MIPRPSDVGVIVGRFQVHRLHDAHLALIKSVYDTHKKTVIVLGLAQARVTHRNPLDFETRKEMILATFPKATVLYLKDDRSDVAWSKKLDDLIDGYVSPAQTVRLYGGRECFIGRYHGRYPTEVFEPERYYSGTELRQSISKSIKGTEDFRAGVIWASANGYPKVFPTVDVAVLRGGVLGSPVEALMVRKPTETQWRFPGGFVQPTDASYEVAARREVAEETGIEIGDMHYVTSIQIDDWRYRHEADKILTTFFQARHVFGPVRPADDVSQAAWMSVDDLAHHIVPEHAPLLETLFSKGVVIR